jgi:uncharacterized membrane protein YraQ (UPF0718 family)
VIATKLLMWAAALGLFAWVWRAGGAAGSKRALRETGQGLLRVLPLIAVALPMSALVAALVPPGLAASWIGTDSGLRGVLVASAVGAFIPGGPVVTFPLVLTFIQAGAGAAQLVALITAWAILALHRILTWEWPLLGPRFVAIRLLSGFCLPLLAGLLAMALLPLFPGALARF